MDTAATDLTFRDATDADVDVLVALIESAYRGDSSRTGWTTEADILEGQRTDPEGVLAVIKAPDSRLLTVEREGAVVACCQLEHRGAHAYFGMFAVSPALQGGGLGKVIIAEAERAPITRSPSQCPGTARSAASAGRVEMCSPSVQGRRDRVAPPAAGRGRRRVRPERSAT